MKNSCKVLFTLLILASNLHGSTTQEPKTQVIDRAALFNLSQLRDLNQSIQGGEFLSHIHMLGSKLPQQITESDAVTDKTKLICATIQALAISFCDERNIATQMMTFGFSNHTKAAPINAQAYEDAYNQYVATNDPQDFVRYFKRVLDDCYTDTALPKLLETDLIRSIKTAGFSPCKLNIHEQTNVKEQQPSKPQETTKKQQCLLL